MLCKLIKDVDRSVIPVYMVPLVLKGLFVGLPVTSPIAKFNQKYAYEIWRGVAVWFRFKPEPNGY